MKAVYKLIIKKIIKNNSKTNMANPNFNKCVPDAVYNYFYISNKGFRWVYPTRLQHYASSCPVIPTVLVILESPHKSEFDNITGNPKLPLMNDNKFKTLFSKKIQPLLSNLSYTNGCFQVVLMNAIQLQCSLGRQTVEYRDYVFLYFWEKLHIDFEKRLSNFLQGNNVCLVVNCCTKGRHKEHKWLSNSKNKTKPGAQKSCNRAFVSELGIKKSLTKKHGCALRDFVAESINVVNVTNIPVLPVSHPASWR